MSRRVAAFFLTVCLLAGGCRTAPVPALAPSEPVPATDGAAAPAPRPETAWHRWSREHPYVAGTLAVGAVVGLIVLTGFLIHEDAKDGNVTPLPLFAG